MSDTLVKTSLVVRDLHGWYADSKVLHGMNFDVNEGEVLTLIGRNGAGKTSTLRAIMGIMRKRTGSIKFHGEELIDKRIYEIARRGLSYCPEERAIFASLNVSENMKLPPVLRSGGMTDADLLTAFPNLKRRATSRGTQLSGGEQQMLAIARILRTGSRFLLLDEPSEGLAPVIVKEIRDLIMKLKSQGFTVILVEQNLQFALSVADRHVVIEHGQVVDILTSEAIQTDFARVQSYIGV